MEREFPIAKGKKILVACSGGVDSMVLVHLLFQSGYSIALAHCNFGLRGDESDEDETFVRRSAEDLGLPFHTKRFETDTFAKEHKVSIQMAARELRYQWFEELLGREGYDYLATGHHADDDMETFFINLSRRTGLRGLRGIPKQNENTIRPLLAFSREEILTYAKENDLYWREDSSNADTKYLRNQIRHTLIPAYKDLGEKAQKGFQSTQNYLDQSSKLIDDYIQLVQKLVVEETAEGIIINIPKLQDLPNTDALLFELLHPYGFTDFDTLRDLLEAQTGKQVLSSSHRILKNREHLLLTVLEIEGPEGRYEIEAATTSMEAPISLAFSQAERFEITNGHTVFVDTETLTYPLLLRKWEEGDSFYPFGMQGKKKLSKFFKDEKLSLVAKENCWLLCSGDQIVWVVGYRMDDRFKVTKQTKKIVRIDYTPN
ncbi:tRNA lysidine(34) synthetase TilS [Aureisphaera galaxeae]|uniref:tRNA lysidine(34) synthetase TilS n=1 Tax=Aureisphaera galaxeae TaxID=1538023 RepID=UPI0023508F06|nr:tRNA lysidine(34) synthetase TilS [Aureisphaera galaxeae]MDC8004767.1 tRNA lysidine(34) synthetase TilS [Aureisphaera galaxeae]